MMIIKNCMRGHTVLTYFVLVLAISWGSALALFGPGVFQGMEAISFVGVGPLAYLTYLAGPSVAGILMTGLVKGKAGLSEIGSRLINWRVGVGWYTVALLTAPLLWTATLSALSLTSTEFLPGIITAKDKMGLLVPGIAVGLIVPIFEETGWTGFAIPELRKKYSILTTGLGVGALWGIWHFPLFAESANHSGAIPPALYMTALLFAWLLPYRVLMVWVYDHTQSLLLAMLMHMPIVVSEFALRPESISGVARFTHLIIFGIALWVLVALVGVGDRRRARQQSLRTRVA